MREGKARRAVHRTPENQPKLPLSLKAVVATITATCDATTASGATGPTESTLLDGRRSQATWGNAGPHSGEREIHGKDESPVRFRRGLHNQQARPGPVPGPLCVSSTGSAAGQQRGSKPALCDERALSVARPITWHFAIGVGRRQPRPRSIGPAPWSRTRRRSLDGSRTMSCSPSRRQPEEAHVCSPRRGSRRP
jgi:hypothetical protein